MLHGISLKLIDTAGIRQTEDIVEKIGVEKARQTAKDADLILYVADSSRPLDENDKDIIRLIQEGKEESDCPCNKSDLDGTLTKDQIKKLDVPVIRNICIGRDGN